MTDFPNLALEELRKRVDAAGSQTAAANQLGVSLSQLNEILNGRRDVSKSILQKIGFDKVVIHVKKQDRSKLLREIGPTLVTFGQNERHA